MPRHLMLLEFGTAAIRALEVDHEFEFDRLLDAGFRYRSAQPMSLLGHKRTFAVQNGMSALPPKADIDWRQPNVRFVPIADIVTR
jgi:hypothetical protein